ncbi:MAG: energy transducer TonB [Kofleriaceae bacterium]
MWNEAPSPVFLIVIAASILAHVTVIAVMPAAESIPVRPPPAILVAIEAVTPPPPPPPVKPVVMPPAPTVAARAAVRSPRPVVHAAARPTVATAEPRPAVVEPADFSGTTLTNEGAGWATPVGDGTPIAGPIAAPGPVARAAGHGTGGPAGDRVVALGDLSRAPRAPNLDTQLAANYPHDARLAGTPGSAVIRVRILVDGRVGPTRVVSESAAGFGVACQHTLAGSHWQPPLDAQQRPVATDLAYTCTFAVAR